MTSENEVPIKINHSSADGSWHRRPAFFWKPITLLGVVVVFLTVSFFILFLIVPQIIWEWLRGGPRAWSIEEVAQLLKSIVDTDNETQQGYLMDGLECTFLYGDQPDPFLESIRLRCQENIDRSGWGGPGGVVDREGLRLILEDVQAFQREQQTS